MNGAATATTIRREALRVIRRISRPRLWQYDYLMLREIAAGLKRQAASLNGGRNLAVLDVGCKYMPYRELFSGRTSRYVGMDLNPYHGVEVRGDAVALPFASASFDLVLCTQTFYLVEDFRKALSEFTRVTRQGGKIILTTIGIWPYPPAVRLHRWSRRELEEVLSEFGEARVEESGGYLQLVPQLTNAVLALGVEGHLVKRHPKVGGWLALPLKGVYLGVNLMGLVSESIVRSASNAGWGVAKTLREVDSHLAINYLAVVTPRK
ncbi:MAG TPA: class I SAM-dependent methyltransferase [Candidatus Polarisedimenticolia bacterium]|nr:class I SAM-dependent methyltransferase [Candidatus Polarisedimenticolia bacterium]